MFSPTQTIETFKRFCSLNTEYQAIDWLRYAVHTTTDQGECWSIKQDTSCIELHVQGNEALLLLWIDGEPPPPMDNIKPSWDASAMVQRVLAQSERFPQALAWADGLDNADWASIWLGTQWWPLEGVTDAVDNPTEWLRWWWTDIMEFTTPPPSLYDTPTTQ